MLNICYLCDEYPPLPIGGIGRMVHTFATTIAKMGHNVTVVGLYDHEDVSDVDGVRVIRLKRCAHGPLRLPRDLRILRRAVKELVRNNGVQIVESRDTGIALAASSLEVPLVMRLHGGGIYFNHYLGRKTSFIDWAIERKALRAADFVVSPSLFAAEGTRKLAGLGNKNIVVIPHGIDLDQFRPLNEAPTEDKLIVFTGTVSAKKGVIELIAAMPRVLADFPDARLVLVGKDTRHKASGESMVETLQKQASTESPGAVEFLGSVPPEEVVKHIRSARVCVFPSHAETFGLAIAEAMSCGKPVVAGNIGPVQEIINEDGVCGLLCDPDSPADIADKIKTCLSDTSLCERLGVKARERIEQSFSLDAMIKLNVEFYEECLRSWRPRGTRQRPSGQRSQGVGG